LIRRIEKIEGLKPSDSNILPKWICGAKNEGEFESLKAAYIRQIQERLEFLRIREVKLTGPVDSLDVEYELRYLARAAGARNPERLHGAACVINDLGAEQRLELFRLLNVIREEIPWEGIDYYRLYNDARNP